eukprot:543801_1
MATKFASAFYEALIAHKKSVEVAFTNSKAELLLEKEMDCCCRHEGHTSQCLCPICRIPRCCSHHHGITSQCLSAKKYIKKNNKMNSNNINCKIPCCAPDVPHSHADKFLLLPKSSKHDEKILTNLPTNCECERIDSRTNTNVGQ